MKNNSWLICYVNKLVTIILLNSEYLQESFIIFFFKVIWLMILDFKILVVILLMFQLLINAHRVT